MEKGKEGYQTPKKGLVQLCTGSEPYMEEFGTEAAGLSGVGGLVVECQRTTGDTTRHATEENDNELRSSVVPLSETALMRDEYKPDESLTADRADRKDKAYQSGWCRCVRRTASQHLALQQSN